MDETTMRTVILNNMEVPFMRAEKRRRYTSSIITLHVGREKEKLFIHENLLRRSGSSLLPYNRKWEEGESRTIELPEEQFDVVAAYLDWLCTGELNMDPNPVDNFYDDVLLAKLHLFAWKIEDSGFVEATIDSLAEGMNAARNRPYRQGALLPSTHAINVVFSCTPDDAPVRDLFVTLFAKYGSREHFEEEEFYPQEFVFGVMRKLLPEECEVCPSADDVCVLWQKAN